jgi:hypothetical protein
MGNLVPESLWQFPWPRFCYDTRREIWPVASVVGTASSADRSSATHSIPAAGGKFRACLTIVQMR